MAFLRTAPIAREPLASTAKRFYTGAYCGWKRTMRQAHSTNAARTCGLPRLVILHGYYRDANGALHFPIDPSGSVGTVLFGLNDRNWVVGRYADGSGATHGLFFVPPNQFSTFDYPGSTFTSLNGINDQGFICGRYVDASGIAHGLLARVRGVPPTNAAGPEMKAFDSRPLFTPLNPSASAWGNAMPAR